jgi:hypothetical protein
MAHDESVTDNQHPLDDLAYDFIAVVKNKADALLAYHKYMQDAEAANSQECMELLRRMYEEDSRHLNEAKQHLSAVLAGRMGQGRAQGQQAQSMGKQGQQSQGQGQGQQGMGQEGKGQQGMMGQQGMGQQGKGQQGQGQQGQGKGQGSDGQSQRR